MAHGLKNERLFVDKEFSYIGATPDGVVREDTIVEVKCPVAAYKNGIENYIKQNKVQILKYNKKNNQVLSSARTATSDGQAAMHFWDMGRRK